MKTTSLVFSFVLSMTKEWLEFGWEPSGINGSLCVCALVIPSIPWFCPAIWISALGLLAQRACPGKWRNSSRVIVATDYRPGFARLAAICLVLSLIDHFYRVIVGHPLHPVLAPALWGVIALVGIPFWRWFGEKLNLSILNFPSQNANVPHWLRIYNWLIDFYVGLNWIVSAFKLDQFLHLQRHSNRLDPYSNGAFLLLLFGNAAASLFAALDRIEDPSNPATWSHISNE